jgi:hypothetical protein
MRTRYKQRAFNRRDRREKPHRPLINQDLSSRAERRVGFADAARSRETLCLAGDQCQISRVMRLMVAAQVGSTRSLDYA